MRDGCAAERHAGKIEHHRTSDKEARRLIQLSISVSQSATGGSGASTNAMYERMQKRIELFASLVLVTAAPSNFL